MSLVTHESVPVAHYHSYHSHEVWESGDSTSFSSTRFVTISDPSVLVYSELICACLTGNGHPKMPRAAWRHRASAIMEIVLKRVSLLVKSDKLVGPVKDHVLA